MVQIGFGLKELFIAGNQALNSWSLSHRSQLQWNLCIMVTVSAGHLSVTAGANSAWARQTAGLVAYKAMVEEEGHVVS